jgi:hypothetical protein
MHFDEVDEISNEDLEATADYYRRILNETLPHKQAERIASEHYDVVLDDNLLNRIMQQFACTDWSLEDCVRSGLEKAGLLNKH